MLVLSRKLNEEIVIDGRVSVRIVAVDAGRIEPRLDANGATEIMAVSTVCITAARTGVAADSMAAADAGKIGSRSDTIGATGTMAGSTVCTTEARTGVATDSMTGVAGCETESRSDTRGAT